MDEQNAILWLSSIKNVDVLVMEKLKNYYGSFLATWENISIKDKELKLKEETLSNILKHKNLAYCDDYKERLYKERVYFVTEVDESYPGRLKNIYNKPNILYYKGKLDELSNTIAIVGARKSTAYGNWVTENYSEYLSSKGLTIVSGLAQGIDTRAHLGALKNKTYNIAVIGSGLNIQYPVQNKRLYSQIEQCGCIISEYPLDMPPLKQNFPQRNRIISGLADSILVIEAKQQSGAMITVNYGLEQGKEIMAIPGNINNAMSRGTNKLIQDGAKLILDYDDVLELYTGYNDGESENVYILSQEEEIVVKELKNGPISIDKLAENLKLDIKLLNVVLTLLEIKGIILRLPGSVVQLTKY